MKKPRKLEIRDVMSAIDRRDKEWLNRQSEDAKKEFAPPVVLRFAATVSGPESEAYLWLVNEVANVDFHLLYKHPELQFKLLTLAGCGRQQRHEWIPVAKTTKKAPKVHAFLSEQYPAANSREIDAVMGKYSVEAFSDLVNLSGLTPEEAKDLISDFKKQSDV